MLAKKSVFERLFLKLRRNLVVEEKFRPKMPSEGAIVAERCHSHSVIKLISDTLDEENMALFRDGPFGELLKLQHAPQNYQCQLFYHFMKLRKELKGGQCSLAFDLNNSELVFGPRDFYLMSGLNFGPFEDCPTTSVLWEESFGSTKTLTMSQIKDAFQTAKESSEHGAGGGETYLKIAHVLFIYGVLFPRDAEAKKLNIQYLHVCDDMERVRQFPWGLYSYKYFVQEFEKSCDRMKSLVRRAVGGKPNIEIFGFLFVFQSWIYEILPTVGADCADILEGWENIYLRVLRWKTTPEQRTFKHLKLLLADAKTLHPLTTSNEEQVRLAGVEQYFDDGILLEHEDEDDHEHQQEAVDAASPQKKSAKRKLNLDSGDCSQKPETKRHPGLRSAKMPLDEHEQSLPSVSTPDAKAKQVLKMLFERMEKLEECCSNMNQNLATLSANMGNMTEKMGIVLEFINAFSINESMRRASTPHNDFCDKENVVCGECPAKLVVDDDKLRSIPIIEIEDCGDGLNEACLDDNGQVLMVHVDDVAHDVADEVGAEVGVDVEFQNMFNDDEYSVTHFEEKFLGRVKKNGDDTANIRVDHLDDDFFQQLDSAGVEGDGDAVEDGADKKESESDAVYQGGDKRESHLDALEEGADKKEGDNKEGDLVIKDDDACDIVIDFRKLDALVDNIAVENFVELKNTTVRGKGAVEVGAETVSNQEDVGSFKVEPSKKEEQVVMRDIEMGKRHTTRSNPIQVSSSNEGSSSLKQNSFIRKRRGVGMVASRFAAPAKGDTVTTMYDPMREYPPDFLRPFQTWYENPQYERSLKLRTYCPLKVGPWFFQKLTNHTEWLSTQNCDALLNLLLFKANLRADLFVTRWTVVENWFAYFLLGRDLTPSCKTFLLRYPNGKSPEMYTKPWSEVDHVYDIARLFQNHFVAFDLCIPKQQIVVYDSMCETSRRWVAVKKQFAVMSLRLPWLCHEVGLSHFNGPVKEAWDIIQNSDTPQQDNGHDCGIYALKCIECLAAGRPVSYLPSEPFDARARDNYCAELFNSRVRQ